VQVTANYLNTTSAGMCYNTDNRQAAESGEVTYWRLVGRQGQRNVSPAGHCCYQCWTHDRTAALPPQNYLYITIVSMDYNESRDDGVAVASAGPYASHLHVTPDR